MKDDAGSNVWLYQLSEDRWSAAEYREEVREGREVDWPTRRRIGGHPQRGDLVITWYAETRNDQPGIYGWGRILSLIPGEEERIVWLPIFPSDHLKDHPIFDEDIAARVDKIRGEVAQGTMWKLA